MYKEYYSLIRESKKGYYYIKVTKAERMKDVDERLRAFGFLVAKTYSKERMKELKEGGKERFLEYKKHTMEMWEAVKGVEV